MNSQAQMKSAYKANAMKNDARPGVVVMSERNNGKMTSSVMAGCDAPAQPGKARGRSMRLRITRLMAGICTLFVAGLLHIAAGAAEAALQYVGGTTGSGTAATYNVNLNGTLTGGLASSPAAGDIVIVVTGWASAADGNPGVTTAGYTEVYDGYANDTRDANLSVSYKIMPGTPDTSVTVSGFNNAANGGATAVHVWRGIDQATPLDVAAPSAPLGVSAINAARPDSPAITPATSGAVIIAVGLGTGAAAPTAMTAPTGFVNGLSATGAGSTMGAVANIASQDWAGGAVDPAAWTGGTTSTSDCWVAGTLALRPAAGPNSTITDCIGCHGYASDGRTYTFADGTARNVPAGQFVGDHAKHDYQCIVCHTDAGVDLAHRNAKIDMAGSISGGTYSKTSPFDQVNNPVGGTCSAVTCHGGSVTPQWGVGSTTCSSCHALPPNTNAHTKHYTAKGWSTGVTTNCTQCHPDNTAGHSTIDSDAIVNAGLVPTGTSPAISCNTTGTGCHNSLVTPAWNTTNIACTSCHTVGAGGANPTSGLHNMSAAGVQKHDDTLQSGNCVNCHNPTKPATHANGVYDANSATYNDRFISRSNMTWTDGTGDTGTCAGTGLTGCHQDNGAWSRLWSTAADSTATTAGDPRCDVCHGQFGVWRTGTSHAGTNGGTASTRGSSHNSLTGAANACEDCHSYPTLIANHQNGQVTLNQSGTYTVTRASGNTYCSNCHTNDGLPSAVGTHTFVSSALTLQTVAGANDPVGDCGGCHGGATVSGSNKNFWPDDVRVHTANQSGRHVKHMTVIARRLYNEDLTTLLVDNGNGTSAAKQKAICEYCHAATTNDSDHPNTLPADVFSTSLGQKAKHLNGAADADAAYAAAADTCSNVDCHNTKLTTDGTFGWYDAGTSTCLLCHSVGAGNNPNSGLHTTTAPTVSGAAGQHDDAFGTGGTCTTCHSGLPNLTTTQANTHINAAFTGDTVGNLGLNAELAYAQSAANVGTCFGAGGGTLTTCHSGTGDQRTWKRVWNSAVNNGTGGAECAGCHGGFNSDWTFGTTANTTDGSVEHGRNWDTPQDGVAEVIGNHSNNTSNAVKCNTCHVYGDPQYILTGGGKHHMDGNITMNTQVTYSGTTWNCSNTCHIDNTNHNLEDSGWTTANLAGPVFTCGTCHSGPPRTGAMAVYSGSSHVSRNGGAYNDCTDCHTAHADGTAAGPNVVYIPTTYSGGAVPTMNNSYASGTHANRIRLGGTATASATYTNAVNASTEAEMCWGCHDKVGTVSEWGSNTQANTGNLDYDYGDLYTDANTVPGTKTSNWTTGVWRSGKGRASGSSSNPFWYKRGAIQSTHSVNFDSGTATVTTTTNPYGYGFSETKDTVANIRCSYCHDVHGTHDTINGDVAGAPYLRGTWKGNQYPEDGAPQWGMHVNWSIEGGSSGFGRVPRAAADPNNSGLNKAIYATQKAGGWWIDQNSNNPTGITSGSTVAQRIAAANASSGLCEQCHGANKNGTWTTSAIGSLNWTTSNGKETNIWVSGYNGHANSVVGGGGIADAPRARNILSRVARGTDRVGQTADATSASRDMGMVSYLDDRGYSYRSSTGSGTGYLWFPKTTSTTTNSGSSASTAFRYFAWGTAPGITPSTRNFNIATGTKMLVFQTATTEATHDAQANYHTFTCAKCHNPHASRLPKLMITNCLDTNHNTWEDFNYTGSPLPAPWTNTRHSQWASAQNCHRLDARAMIPSGGTTLLGRGWNRVTPWMEFTNPNSTRATNPNP